MCSASKTPSSTFMLLTNCRHLENSLAYIEMRLILAKMMYKFDLQLASESKDWLDQKVFLVWEKKPLMVKIKLAKGM